MAKLIVDGIQIVSLLMNKNEDFQIVSLLMNKNEDFQNVWLLMHINEDIQNVWLMHKNAGMQTVLATTPRMILESVLFLLMYLVFVVCTLVWIGLRGRRFGNPAEAKAPTNE